MLAPTTTTFGAIAAQAAQRQIHKRGRWGESINIQNVTPSSDLSCTLSRRGENSFNLVSIQLIKFPVFSIPSFPGKQSRMPIIPNPYSQQPTIFLQFARHNKTKSVCNIKSHVSSLWDHKSAAVKCLTLLFNMYFVLLGSSSTYT